ncbi:MAG: hypothetical protein CR987_00835 [Draconibacterium sp.]|nr:MAG: hypothetical protein CR987_00835 [Draconibacterium sp.]
MLLIKEIVSTQIFTNHPPRFTEASLVKRLEELGIGRPSTYAPTISTIQKRNYIVKEDRPGVQREYNVMTLAKGDIKDETKTQTTGNERAKLFPTDIGMVVTDFLKDNFKDIMDYNFTADVEKKFDDIADGALQWNKMLEDFYQPFSKLVEDALENSQRQKGERILGDDPKTGKPVLVRIGRYGPMAQLGQISDNEEEKPKFASLRKDQHIETITLEEALDLFKLPRDLGLYEDKKVVVAIGRFGPYVRHDSKFVSLEKEDDPLSIDLPRAIELIEAKREKDRKALIKEFDEEPDLKVLEGRWGPYIKYKKKNYKIPKTTEAESLTLEACMELINNPPKPTKRTRKKSTTKKK